MNKFFSSFKNASVDELIELSHEDNLERKTSPKIRRSDQIMDRIPCKSFQRNTKTYNDHCKIYGTLILIKSYLLLIYDILGLDVIGYRNEDGNYILPKEYDEAYLGKWDANVAFEDDPHT